MCPKFNERDYQGTAASLLSKTTRWLWFDQHVDLQYLGSCNCASTKILAWLFFLTINPGSESESPLGVKAPALTLHATGQCWQSMAVSPNWVLSAFKMEAYRMHQFPNGIPYIPGQPSRASHHADQSPIGRMLTSRIFHKCCDYCTQKNIHHLHVIVFEYVCK